ncbi:hypothetical protein ACS0TY_019939 [Phlomoides rotata]
MLFSNIYYIDYAKEGIYIVSGMGENEVISICILVVKEDVACNNIIARMLHGCKHRALRTGGILDVLHAIWEKKDRLDIVLTNADRLGSSGPEIIKHIQDTLHLRVMSISIDKRKLESRGQPFSFEAFILNGSSLSDVNKLCRIALERERGKTVAACHEENVKKSSIPNTSVEINKTSSSIMDATHLNQKHKAVDLSDGSAEDHPTTKKQRVTWTPEKHKKFLEAIDLLGYENAVPKKIVEVMNDPELTRENVASHLQKYRLCLKRAQEISSLSGMNARNDFQGLSELLSSSFGSNFEMRDYTSIEGLLFSDRNGLEKSQQVHVPKVHITPNFGIYEDHKRNMLLSIDNNVSSSKFVGIRVTNDGKCVGYGNAEASSMINTESFVSTGHSVSGIHGNHSPTRTSTSSFINACRGLALHSPPAQKTGDEYPFNLDLSAPPSVTSEQHISLHQIGDSGNEEDTEKHCPLGDQDTSVMQSWETSVPFPIQSEMDTLVQNESVPSSMFHCDQDFSIPVPVQTSMTFLLGHYDERGFDGPLQEGTGSTSHQFDLEEFDWSD